MPSHIEEEDYLLCKECRKPPTKNGHDFCIADLPGVCAACCGHGDRERAYIMFKNGLVIREFIICVDTSSNKNVIERMEEIKEDV